ncbi:Mitochondrial-processing peptidase subunit alpha [Pichia californica]|uniref:Mitochondrial-processing peptidase subunit alpha n=1 Tax=Pichia californica TaxID=460514 RepID=A0A9P7BGS5_9ASCO|nr:Mitochondrial-processing peptidase subunit alpha [[Candida] californica]KAG0689585.1 Mitochondrial-processing peptidase subunit alpha [[Candida] californica]
MLSRSFTCQTASNASRRLLKNTFRIIQTGKYSTNNNSTNVNLSTPTIIKTLPNGIKLAIDPTPSYFSAIGFYVTAGSRYEETYGLTGCSHILDKLSFKSTENYSTKQMADSLNKLGGNYMCASSREAMLYQASVFNHDVEKMFGLLSETVLKPNLLNDEINEQLISAEYELNEIWLQSDLILPELFQQVAYNNSNLGCPLLCPADKLRSINRDELLRYRDIFYRPENLVIAFSGVGETQVNELIEKYIPESSTVSSEKLIKEPALYTGGEFSLPVPEGLEYRGEEFHHIYVGFEGVDISSEDVYKLAVLQMLIGGGGSFSAGGPGKGMYSRAYTRVLNQYGFVESCKSFIHNFTDSGLFGLSLACVPQANRVMSELIGYELNLLMSRDIGKGGISEHEVSRAKNQLKSSLMMNLESKMVQLEDMGRQEQIYGKRIDVLEMCSKIDAITRNDLIQIAEKIFTGSEPTIVVQGDREAFGDIKGMLNRYGLGNIGGNQTTGNEKKTKSRGWF